jgi:hypothetical protein
MDPNMYSTQPSGPPDRHPDGLAALAAEVDALAAQDLDRLPDPIRAERVLQLRRLADRLEGHWLKEPAGSTPTTPPAPTTTSRSARPPAGCGPGCA